MKRSIVFMMCLLLTGTFQFVKAQDADTCGTIGQGPISPSLAIYSSYTNLSNAAWVDIPIAVHIIRDAQGNNGLNESILTPALSLLNNAYYGAKMNFFIKSIDYYDSEEWGGVNGRAPASPEEQDEFDFNYKVGAINLYCTPHGLSYNGVATFTPDIATTLLQGQRFTQNIIIWNDALNSFVLPHEIGHYFNLFHTHESSINGIDCPEAEQGGTKGDLIFETVPEPFRNDGVDNFRGTGGVPTCELNETLLTEKCTNNETYNVQAINSVNATNIMSYSACRNVLFTEQLERARTTYDVKRLELHPLAPPILTSPSNEAIGVANTTGFTWESAQSATSYRIQLSLDQTFQTGVSTITTTETSWPASWLQEYKKYYWRIFAINEVDSTASETFWFITTAQPPGVATLTSPLNGEASVLVPTSFNWNDVQYATEYDIQIDTDYQFSNPITIETTIPSSGFTTSQLQFSTLYFWRVRAKNIAYTGDWSSYRSFTTEPPKPVLSYPTNGATNVESVVQLSWTTVPNATGYQLQVNTSTNFSSPIISLTDSEVPTNSYQLAMNTSTTYYWRVRAKTSGGWGSWSIVQSWTTGSEQSVVPASTTTGSYWYATTLSLSQDVTILAGKKLTIKPGSTISFTNGSSLIVKGELNAQGTSSQGIIFDGLSYVRQDDLAMIRFEDLGKSTLRYCVLRNANFQVFVTTTGAAGSQNIQYCTFENFGYGTQELGYALRITQSPVNHTVFYNTFDGRNGSVAGNSIGIMCSNTGVTSSVAQFRWNTITYCFTGIQLYSTRAGLEDNIIDYCTNYGIQAEQIPSSVYNYDRNHLRYNGVGMFLSSVSATEKMHGNRISYNTGSGIYAVSSSLNLRDGYNVLRGNSGAGIEISTSSGLIMGTGVDDYGWNSVYDNGTYALKIMNSSYMYGDNNYWSNSTFYKSSTSTMSVGTKLTYDPNNGEYLSIQNNDPVTTGGAVSLSMINADSSDDEFENAISQADNLRLQGKIQEAATLLASFVLNPAKPDIANIALVVMHDLINEETVAKDPSTELGSVRKQFEEFLATLVAREDDNLVKPQALRMLSRLAAADARFDLAQLYDDQLIAEFPNSEYTKSALYDRIAYFAVSRDFSVAKRFLDQMEKQWPNAEEITLARIVIGIRKNSQSVSQIQQEQSELTTEEIQPVRFGLEANYPNPFNPTTVIAFELPIVSHVSLRVYDMLGNEVAKLVDGVRSEGKHKIQFNASDLPSGVYYYRLEAGKFSQVRSMLLVK